MEIKGKGLKIKRFIKNKKKETHVFRLGALGRSSSTRRFRRASSLKTERTFPNKAKVFEIISFLTKKQHEKLLERYSYIIEVHILMRLIVRGRFCLKSSVAS